MNRKLPNGWKVVDGQLVDPGGNALGGVDEKVTTAQYEECIGLPPPGLFLHLIEDGEFVLAMDAATSITMRRVTKPLRS